MRFSIIKNITISLFLSCSVTGYSMPQNFSVISSEYEYQLIINNKIAAAANAGIGCYQLGSDIKCFTINLDQYGGTNCQEVVYSPIGAIKKPMSNFICGSFAITELLNDPRTTLGYYLDDLLNIDFINRLNDFYIYGKRVELPLGYNTAPAVVYIYGTAGTTTKTFEETSSVIENILLAIDKPLLRAKLDGQRFIITGTNDRPSQMPGLSELGVPSWVDTITKGFSMWDLRTTIVSDEMICRAPNQNLKYFDYEQVIHQMAYTIMDTFKLDAHIIEDSVRADSKTYGGFENDGYMRETFPNMMEAWFDSNFNKLGPYNRFDLKTQFPRTYNYLSTLFNVNNNWKPKCSSYIGPVRPNVVEPIYHDFYYYPEYFTYRDSYRQNDYGYYRQNQQRYIFNIYVKDLFGSNKNKKRNRGYARTGYIESKRIKNRPVVFRTTKPVTSTPITPITNTATSPNNSSAPTTPNNQPNINNPIVTSSPVATSTVQSPSQSQPTQISPSATSTLPMNNPAPVTQITPAPVTNTPPATIIIAPDQKTTEPAPFAPVPPIDTPTDEVQSQPSQKSETPLTQPQVLEPKPEVIIIPENKQPIPVQEVIPEPVTPPVPLIPQVESLPAPPALPEPIQHSVPVQAPIIVPNVPTIVAPPPVAPAPPPLLEAAPVVEEKKSDSPQ